ncbi:hypothetical protein [Aliivibrio kagoshimensis]|uniref:hypothetical protein n=1 Tax=Aliivibrio kagoshimensis TaxID=2910230 RepID=UPI003D123082
MASKNPVKGYILCPTHGCGEVCTVHAVGEHKAITEGETPKNKRRLGQLYLICPECKTNQQAGKPFQTWLASGMQTTAEAVHLNSNCPTVTPKPEKVVSEVVTKPLLTSDSKGLDDSELTNSNHSETSDSNLIGWVVGLMIICMGLFFMASNKTKEA